MTVSVGSSTSMSLRRDTRNRVSGHYGLIQDLRSSLNRVPGSGHPGLQHPRTSTGHPEGVSRTSVPHRPGCQISRTTNHHCEVGRTSCLLEELVDLVLIAVHSVERLDLSSADHPPLEPILVDLGSRPLCVKLEVTQHGVLTRSG